MSNFSCPKCGLTMRQTDEDGGRQEWYSEILYCEECDKSYEHRTEYDSGLVTSDTLEEIKE